MTNSTHAAVSILIGADLRKSFRDSFSGANKQLSALGDTIKKVNDKASEIEAFSRKETRLLFYRLFPFCCELVGLIYKLCTAFGVKS